MLLWEPPDMPPEVLGYRVYIGEESREYSESFDVGLNTHFSLMGLNDGEYFFGVTAYNGNGEGDFGNEASTIIITSVQENETEAVPVFAIYPNPFSSFTIIQGKGEVRIVNILGQLMQTVPEHQKTVDVSEFSIGAYYFCLLKDNEIIKVIRGVKIRQVEIN